jgi:hypothetical protein
MIDFVVLKALTLKEQLFRWKYIGEHVTKFVCTYL